MSDPASPRCPCCGGHSVGCYMSDVNDLGEYDRWILIKDADK